MIYRVKIEILNADSEVVGEGFAVRDGRPVSAYQQALSRATDDLHRRGRYAAQQVKQLAGDLADERAERGKQRDEANRWMERALDAERRIGVKHGTPAPVHVGPTPAQPGVYVGTPAPGSVYVGDPIPSPLGGTAARAPIPGFDEAKLILPVGERP
jgi:hypothetical protein